VLEAKAGLGKTALLAYLVKERGYIHHFVELAPGADGIGPGLKNLAAQLVRSWKLNPYGLDEVLPGAATRPDYLQTLLVEAARKRDEVAPGEKIVVVVDALDEAGTPPGQNVLGLPGVVPEGVYFLVSQRPVEVSLMVDTSRRVVTLEAGDANNLADMRAYVERTAGLEKISQALRKSEFSPDRFVEKLLDKSRGVWIYLHYVVGEIESGGTVSAGTRNLASGGVAVLCPLLAAMAKRARRRVGRDPTAAAHQPGRRPGRLFPEVPLFRFRRDG
jgi:hypothetical protein